MDFLQYLLAFLVTLGVLVTVHEFGHYLVARSSGVRIVRFAVGFGRPLFSWVDKRDTEFSLCAIPLGGYVRMFDDRDLDVGVDKPPGTTAYMDLHPAWRVAIALGGPAANFVLAGFVYWALAVAGSFQMMPVMGSAEAGSPAALAGMDRPQQILAVDGKNTSGWQEIGLALTERLGETGAIVFTVRDLRSAAVTDIRVPITAWHEGSGDPDVLGSLGLRPAVLSLAGELVEGSPAERGGLKPGDLIVAVNAKPVVYWEEWVEEIEVNPNRSIVLDVYRDGRLRQLPVTPGSRKLDDGTEVGSLGVYQAQSKVEHSLLSAIPAALNETWAKSVLILSVVKKMITGQVSVKNLSGPISIAQVAGDSAEYGWRPYIGILAFLSLSLGVFNLLPIPVLDGGHVIFNGVEWITGRPVPERVQIVGVQVGLLLVGCTMVLALYNDFVRLFQSG